MTSRSPEMIEKVRQMLAQDLPGSFEPTATVYPAGSARVAQDWKMDTATR